MAKKETSEQSNEQALQEAQSQKASYENEKSQKQSQINTNKDKIERLKTVKSTLKIDKEDAANKASEILSYAQTDTNFDIWNDDLCTKIREVLADEVSKEYTNYAERIDEVLDAVCNEITRLENENMQLNWDILRIGSAINWLIDEIATLCN